jgi:phosphohistidine phosphatase
MASVDELCELVREIPDNVENALLIGHNPGLERLVVELTHDDNRGLRANVAEKFPTAALAVIKLPANRWAEIESGGGKVVELILPKELD